MRMHRAEIRARGAWLGLCWLAVAGGCERAARTPTEPVACCAANPAPASSPSVAPSPGEPVAAPSPPAQTPPPAPAPSPANRPPTVTIVSSGPCHPSAAGSTRGARPCTVAFTALDVSDPDGDPVALAWSGCATGAGPSATCLIVAPGEFSATVTATDGRGGRAAASASAVGANAPPRVSFGRPRPSDPSSPGQTYSLVGGQPEDPDGDEEGNTLCRRVAFTVSGPCRAGYTCGGVGDVFDVDITTLPGSGTCVLEANTRDSWGAQGSDRLMFRVWEP